MTSSHIGSQSGSESGLLGSVSSLNDIDVVEGVDQEYIPIPGRVVCLIIQINNSNNNHCGFGLHFSLFHS